MSSNYIEGSSESLVIAEAKQGFDVNCSEQKPPEDDDLFDLSRDEVSLSFQIEEEQNINQIRQLCRKSKDDTIEFKIDDPPPETKQRKRREIFERFKKNEKSIEERVEEESKGTDNLLNIFDSIFSKKIPDPANLCGMFDANRSKDENRLVIEEISSRERTPSAERRARLKIFERKKNTDSYESMLPSNILDDSPPRHDISPRVGTEADMASPTRNQSISFENIEKRVSLIIPFESNESRDSLEINNILESEIFREETQIKESANGEDTKILETNTSEKNMERTYQKQMEAQNSLKTITRSETKDEQMFKKKETPLIAPFVAEPINLQTYTDRDTLVKGHQAEVHPVDTKEFNPLSDYPLEQTKYLGNNDMSELSSNPSSVYIQNYESRKLLVHQNSMANIPIRTFEELPSTPRTTMADNEGNIYIADQMLVESRIIENVQAIEVVHLLEEQARIPQFLRSLRKVISVYPNLYIMSNTPNTSEVVSRQFYILLEEIKKVIAFLSSVIRKVLTVQLKKKEYVEAITNNMSVDTFLESRWLQICSFEDYEMIKPTEPIQVRGWRHEKAKNALDNYEGVVRHYGTKGLKMDLTSDKGRKKYFDIRQKFWDICGNMKLISEDIFCEMNNCRFPGHYSECSDYLKEPFPVRMTEQRLTFIKDRTNNLLSLKRSNDELANSSIGAKMLSKLQLQMRYLNPY